MRSKFDEQLKELNNEMIKMGNMVEESIAKAVTALSVSNADMAKQIMDNDELVDKEQKKIENICFQLLIQQQPVASDLRIITAAMKMVTDMERIGDHAADISEMTILMSNTNEAIPKIEHINKMAAETVMMLNWSIEAYVERSEIKAKEVIAHDDVVDNLFLEVKNDIIDLIKNNPKEGEQAFDMIMVAKYFERIGDHATNIAEWVLFSLANTDELS